ncbi:homocitrate synthase, mitochondrial precursor [Clavispora lusitaniae ATCC 42720]|uniref:Homocitrate synthase, mitochondrial n=1 Tax=Clavispora lusitaniae (strain ATCC 42720) TaxID=306902 RepID=C4YAG3_CLAL4|nr:homocitrate synthase, mitochondrial precursor [Clavispora lusitaniae ATCC 42720]EEQ40972.1 homocitrate synthase, mitochondrial precursor [Clavispora lusitaniae ATCC 42720]
MVILDDGVHVINVQSSDVAQQLNLVCHLLTSSVGQVQVQSVNTRLDGVPSGQTVGKMDVSGQAKVGWIQNLIRRRIGQDSLGMDTSLVGEGTETGDGVVEWDVHSNSISHQVLQVTQLVQLVLGQDIVTVSRDHTGHQGTQRRDTVSLTNAQNGNVNQLGSSLQSRVRIGNGTASVVVEVALNVTRHDRLQSLDQVVHSSWVGTSNSVGNTNSVDTNLVDSLVNVQQINNVRTERVFGRETNLNALGLDKLNHLNGRLSNVVHVLAVRISSQESRCANNNINTVHAGLHGHSGIVHVTTNMRQDLGLQAQLANGLAVSSRSFRSNRRGQFDVVHTEIVQGLGNLNLLFCGEKGIGKSLALSQSGFDNLELVNVR